MKVALILEIELDVADGEASRRLSNLSMSTQHIVSGIDGVNIEKVTVVTQGDYDKLAEHLKGETCGIVVNGTHHHFSPNTMTYEDVMMIANSSDRPSLRQFIKGATITYRYAAGDKPNGVMVEGDEVTIQEGTIFNVAMTGSA